MPEPDDLEDNLKAQHEQLRELERRVAQLKAASLGDADVRGLEALEPLRPEGYEELSRANREYLESRDRAHLALEDMLEPEQLRLLQLESDRLRWDTSDYITVGLCALLGGAALLLQGAIDQAVLEATGMMERTELIERWKTETTNLPIDYQGQGAGGAGHRVTSAGHDPGRPVAAIQQIMQGRYEGTAWSAFAGKISPTALGTPYGTPFDAVTDPRLAAGLWVKHLLTDIVTVSSLPLPGWTALYESAPTGDLAEFFKDMYWSNGAPGWNVRTLGVTKMVPLVIVEVGIRSKLAWDTYQQRGTLRLEALEKDKRDEMLLAASGVLALMSVGRVAFECFTTSSPLGLRALNPPLVLRAAHLGVRVVKAHRQQSASDVPSWSELARTALPLDSDRLGPYAI